MKVTNPTARTFLVARLRFAIASALCAAVFFGPGLGARSAQAAIAQRGAATTTTGAEDATTLVIHVPTGVVAGDVMIVNIVEYDAVTGYPTCSGWTLIKSNSFAAAKTGHGAVLYKVSTGSEPASYTFTLTGTPVQSLGSMVAFSGVDTTGGYKQDGTSGGPFDVTPVAVLVSSSSTATAVGATAITTASANAGVIMFGMGFGPASASTWSGWTTTSPGTLTELYDNQAGSGIDKAMTIGAAWATKSTAGTTGAGAATLSSGCKNGGILIALKPASTRLVITGSGSQTAGASQNLTITARIGVNTDTTYTGSKNLTFSGANSSANPVTAPTVMNSSGTAVAFGSTTAITFSSGVATVSSGNNGAMVLYMAESATIAATDGTISAAGADRLTVVVSAAAANKLVVTTQPSASTAAGVAFATHPVVKIEDQFGNVVTTGADSVRVVTAALTTGSGTLSGTLTKTAVAGIADFTGQGLSINLVGTDKVLTFTTTGGVITGTTTSPAFTIAPGALHHFAVSSISSPQTAGTAFSIGPITAQDLNGNTVTSFTGTVDLAETGSGAGGTVTPSPSGAFAAGVRSSETVTLTKAGTGVTITATEHNGTKTGVSGTFTVNPGAINHYAVTFSSPPYHAGTPFTTIVTAQDVNNNPVTTDSTTSVVVSSSSLNMGWDATGIGEFNNGLMPGEEYHITKTLTTGVASFSTRDDVAEAGKTITATSTGPITGTSAAIDIDTLAGAYRSKISGNWGDAGTWQTYNGSAWVAATATPSSSDGVITIQTGHTVTVGANVTVDQVHIQVGGQVNVSSGVTLTIGSVSSPGLEVYGTLHNEGTLTLNSGSYSFVWTGGVLENSGTINSAFETLEFEPGSPGGKYRHLFTTTEGMIPTAEWEVGSVCEIAGYTSNTTPPSGLNQSFHHFIWNCPSQTGTIALGGNPTALEGDFMVTSTGSGAITLGGNLAVAGTATVGSEAKLNCVTYTITGPLFILGSGGTLGIGSPDGITSSGTSGNIQTTTRTFSTDGNYIYNGTEAQSAGSGLPASVNNLTIANSVGVAFSGNISVYSACTINGSALFKAGGTISGLVTVNGTLNPGGSGVGTLNTGGESWNGGGTNVIEINNATGAAGTGLDWLNISGTLAVSATSGSKFTIKVISLSGSSAGEAANFVNTLNYNWRIATASDGVSGFDPDKFTIDDSGFQNGKGTVGAFSVSQSGNDVYLDFTPVFANAAGYGRAWGTFQRLSVNSLLSNQTTGNAARELVSVATGSRGTAPTVSGGLILLAPTHNFSETFQYVVQLTGQPSSLATNIITLSVTNAVSRVNGITSSGGSVTIKLAGVPGYNYVVERTSDISNGPWMVITGSETNTPSTGVWTFTDLFPPNPSFYRTRQNN